MDECWCVLLGEWLTKFVMSKSVLKFLRVVDDVIG